MIGKKWNRSRKLHKLVLIIFLSLIFYSFTVIRKSIIDIVCKERWLAKLNKAQSEEILQDCVDITGSMLNCKNKQMIGSSIAQNSLMEKYIVLGELKPNKGILTIGYIHTEDCAKSENLDRSLGSLFSHLKKTKNDEVSVVLLLRDCSEIETTSFLDRMHTKYMYWISNHVLQIVQMPDEFKLHTKDNGQYWESFTSYSPEYIKKSKSLLRNIAFLWTFSATQSDYFIQFTDHVIVEGDILSPLLASKKYWSSNYWLWAEDYQGFLTGSMYKTDSFTELVELLDIFGNDMPVNFILKFYKRNFRISRKVYEMPKPLPIRENFEFNGDNPEAAVTTSLVQGGGVSLQDLYKYRKGYFWAWTPNEGDYILIDLKAFIHIKRVVIETGAYLYEDIFPGGVVSAVFEDESMKTSPRPACHETGKFEPLAEFREPSVEIKGSKISNKAMGCIKINVTPIKSKVYDSWIIIRTIAIFTK